MESIEKIRVSLFLDKNLVETADKIMKERGYRSRNQFYSALIADAVADEVTDKHKEILGEKFADCAVRFRWNRSLPAITQRIKSKLFCRQKMKKISKVAGYSKRVVVCCCADKERSAA